MKSQAAKMEKTINTDVHIPIVNVGHVVMYPD